MGERDPERAELKGARAMLLLLHQHHKNTQRCVDVPAHACGGAILLIIKVIVRFLLCGAAVAARDEERAELKKTDDDGEGEADDHVEPPSEEVANLVWDFADNERTGGRDQHRDDERELEEEERPREDVHDAKAASVRADDSEKRDDGEDAAEAHQRDRKRRHLLVRLNKVICTKIVDGDTCERTRGGGRWRRGGGMERTRSHRAPSQTERGPGAAP